MRAISESLFYAFIVSIISFCFLSSRFSLPSLPSSAPTAMQNQTRIEQPYTTCFYSEMRCISHITKETFPPPSSHDLFASIELFGETYSYSYSRASTQQQQQRQTEDSIIKTTIPPTGQRRPTTVTISSAISTPSSISSPYILFVPLPPNLFLDPDSPVVSCVNCHNESFHAPPRGVDIEKPAYDNAIPPLSITAVSFYVSNSEEDTEVSFTVNVRYQQPKLNLEGVDIVVQIHSPILAIAGGGEYFVGADQEINVIRGNLGDLLVVIIVTGFAVAVGMVVVIRAVLNLD